MIQPASPATTTTTTTCGCDLAPPFFCFSSYAGGTRNHPGVVVDVVSTLYTHEILDWRRCGAGLIIIISPCGIPATRATTPVKALHCAVFFVLIVVFIFSLSLLFFSAVRCCYPHPSCARTLLVVLSATNIGHGNEATLVEPGSHNVGAAVLSTLEQSPAKLHLRLLDPAAQ